ncbi:MAG TPA: hypothetical protein PLA91_04700 [Bacillota bacterium]|nr:hypothetical protein [Bacillota bacterium]
MAALALKGTCEAAVTAVPTISARILKIMIKNKKNKDRKMLFSLEEKVSENSVKNTARKKEPKPTKRIYLLVTVDLLLPNKSHLMQR